MFFGRLTPGPIAGLRTRATLLAPVETLDEIGGVARSFAPIANLWCRLEPSQGDERFLDGRREETTSYRVMMRWRGDITAAMRLAIGARIFDIHANTDPDGRRRRLVVLAEEVKP